jgi:hypothetical protein
MQIFSRCAELQNQKQQHSQSFQDESEQSDNDDEDELFLGLDTFTSKQNKMILEEVQKQGIDQYATFGNLDFEEESLVILISLNSSVLSHSHSLSL